MLGDSNAASKTSRRRAANRALTNRAPGASGKSTAQIVRQANQWRDSFNALRALTIAKVVSLIEAGQRGDFAELQLVMRRLERRFPVLKALKARRLAALEKLDWEIKVMDPLPPGVTEEQAEKQRDFLRSRYDLIENLSETFGQLALAEFRGFAILQKHRFEDGPNDGAVREFHWLPQFCWSRAGEFGDWYLNEKSTFGVGGTACAATLGERNRLGSEELPRAEFLVREHDTPLYEIALIAFVNWSLGRKDWAAFVEVFGLPNAVVVMPSNVPPEKQDEYLSAAEKVADGVSGALPNGSDVKFPTASVRGNAPFKEFCDANVEDVVLAGTGGLLTMLSQPTGIGQGASGEHGDAFDDIAKADARRINEVLQRDFDRVELAAQFSGQPVAVYFELAAEEQEDTKVVVENYGVAVRAGVVTPNRDDESHFREKLALPPMSKDVEREWKAVGGTRAPITVQQEGLGSPAAPAPAPKVVGKPAVEPQDDLEDEPKDDDVVTNRQRILNSQAAVAKAVAADLAPVLAALDERLARIVEITDPALRQQKFDEAWAELESLIKDIQADPATARALEQITAPALAAGLAGQPAVTNRK